MHSPGPIRLCSAGAVLVIGCSDYNFSPDKEANTGAKETGLIEGPVDSAPPDPVETGDSAPPVPPTCEDAEPGVLPLATIDATCLVQSGWGLFEPTVEWQWSTNPEHPGYNQIMSTAMVANLTDDNGDGNIDEADIPDIVFTTFSGSAYTSPGAITAISGDGSGQHWSLTNSNGYRPYSSSAPAIADIDADGSPDICVASADATVLCLEADGSFKWAAGATTYVRHAHHRRSRCRRVGRSGDGQRDLRVGWHRAGAGHLGMQRPGGFGHPGRPRLRRTARSRNGLSRHRARRHAHLGRWLRRRHRGGG